MRADQTCRCGRRRGRRTDWAASLAVVTAATFASAAFSTFTAFTLTLAVDGTRPDATWRARELRMDVGVACAVAEHLLDPLVELQLRDYKDFELIGCELERLCVEAGGGVHHDAHLRGVVGLRREREAVAAA